MFHYIWAIRKPMIPQFPIWHYAQDVEHNDSTKVPRVSLAHEGSIDDVPRMTSTTTSILRMSTGYRFAKSYPPPMTAE